MAVVEGKQIWRGDERLGRIARSHPYGSRIACRRAHGNKPFLAALSGDDHRFKLTLELVHGQ